MCGIAGLFCQEAPARAEPRELLPQFQVVVDLAVLHRPEAAALVGDRLIPVGEVDVRQARVDHADAGIEIESDAVGPAVRELTGHRE